MLPREDVQPEEKREPCAVCDAESETTVWDHPICYTCFGDWSREPSVTAGAIGFDPADTFIARARETTAKWIRARKAVRR